MIKTIYILPTINGDIMEKIKCKCGCGKIIDKFDKYGRERKYISGHNGRKYKDPLEYKKVYNNKPKTKARKTEYRYYKRHERKIELIKYKGGQCKICDIKFNNNSEIFDFHHRVSINKKFGISGNVMEMSIENLKSEVDKCDLVCSNCHRTIHFTKDKYEKRKKEN